MKKILLIYKRIKDENKIIFDLEASPIVEEDSLEGVKVAVIASLDSLCDSITDMADLIYNTHQPPVTTEEQSLEKNENFNYRVSGYKKDEDDYYKFIVRAIKIKDSSCFDYRFNLIIGINCYEDNKEEEAIDLLREALIVTSLISRRLELGFMDVEVREVEHD